MSYRKSLLVMYVYTQWCVYVNPKIPIHPSLTPFLFGKPKFVFNICKSVSAVYITSFVAFLKIKFLCHFVLIFTSFAFSSIRSLPLSCPPLPALPTEQRGHKPRALAASAGMPAAFPQEQKTPDTSNFGVSSKDLGSLARIFALKSTGSSSY